MTKRKVIKFVFQGYRCLRPQEWFEHDGKYEMWTDKLNSIGTYDVYHKIETEEEFPRWRAEHGGVYYRANVFLQIVSVTENYCILDNVAFDSGNYFQTEEQAQEYIDHCKKFFENN
jgi:hypothetical protein